MDSRIPTTTNNILEEEIGKFCLFGRLKVAKCSFFGRGSVQIFPIWNAEGGKMFLFGTRVSANFSYLER
jgi:hypothetical protein